MRRAAIAAVLMTVVGCGGSSGTGTTAPAPDTSTGDTAATTTDTQPEAGAPDEAPAEPCARVEQAGYAPSAPENALVRLRVRAEVETGDTLGVCPGDALMTGDLVHFEVETNEPAHVALVHVGPGGSPTLLRGAGEPALDGALRIPEEGGFPLDDNTGDETLVLVASREPLSDIAPDLAAQLSDPPQTGGALAEPRGEAGVDTEARTVHAAPDEQGVVLVRFHFRHLEAGSLSGSRGVILEE